jgi:CRP-like cAMP-binding protein
MVESSISIVKYMNLAFSPTYTPRPFLTWQRVSDWAEEHYRCRTFEKDERIPTRSGLIYLVQRGVIRLVGTTIPETEGETEIDIEVDTEVESGEENSPHPMAEEAFLGFVGVAQPFEIVTHSPFVVDAYAHTEKTSVVWLYWEELDNWPNFRREIMDEFRYQHQRKLLWLSTLGQRRTIDRLIGLLRLLMEEFGEPCEEGYCLPFPLTHAQVGSAIGSTRVTVTRLMGKLRQRKLVQIKKDNLICLSGELTG